jgi:hypothetical protein
MTFAHIAGVPLEELFAMMPAAGAFWLGLRARWRGALSPRFRAGSRRSRDPAHGC